MLNPPARSGVFSPNLSEDQLLFGDKNSSPLHKNYILFYEAF
jgi:hypothetical protein